MAKKKAEQEVVTHSTSDLVRKEIQKKFGSEAFVNGNFIVERQRRIIPFSPALDLILNGGVPEGSWLLVSGIYKSGKSTSILDFAATCQKEENGSKDIYYADVEGRLKPLNLKGIRGLNLDKFHVIRSSSGKILSGEDYVSSIIEIAKNCPESVIIVDSTSALCSDKELTDDVTGQARNLGPKLLSTMTRQLSGVVPVNNLILILVQHLYQNSSGYGKAWLESSGTKIQYAADIKLLAKKWEFWKLGDKTVGQKISWTAETTALGPPGGVIDSYIRYGGGIDKTFELISIGRELGLITGSSWLTCDFLVNDDSELTNSFVEQSGVDRTKAFQFHGFQPLYDFFELETQFVNFLYKKIRDMLI